MNACCLFDLLSGEAVWGYSLTFCGLLTLSGRLEDINSVESRQIVFSGQRIYIPDTSSKIWPCQRVTRLVPVSCNWVHRWKQRADPFGFAVETKPPSNSFWYRQLILMLIYCLTEKSPQTKLFFFLQLILTVAKLDRPRKCISFSFNSIT